MFFFLNPACGQVTGELLGPDGQVLGRSSRHAMLLDQVPAAQWLAALLATPLSLLGLHKQSTHIKLCLFDRWVHRKHMVPSATATACCCYITAEAFFRAVCVAIIHTSTCDLVVAFNQG